MLIISQLISQLDRMGEAEATSTSTTDRSREWDLSSSTSQPSSEQQGCLSPLYSSSSQTTPSLPVHPSEPSHLTPLISNPPVPISFPPNPPLVMQLSPYQEAVH